MNNLNYLQPFMINNVSWVKVSEEEIIKGKKQFLNINLHYNLLSASNKELMAIENDVTIWNNTII